MSDEQLTAEEAAREAAADNVPMVRVVADFRRVMMHQRAAMQEAMEAAADDVPIADVLAQFRSTFAAAELHTPADRAAFNAAWWAKRPRPMARAKPNLDHRYLDEWATARPGPLRDLIGDLTPAIDATEGAGRARERKPADKDRFDDACGILLTNLAEAVFDPPITGRLAFCLGHQRGKRPRISNGAFGEKTKTTLEAMAALGIIDELRDPPVMSGEASTFAPGEDFAAVVVASAISHRDIGRHPGEPSIKLRRQQPRGTSGRPTPRPVAYDDTPETVAMAAEMKRLNAFLEDADIAFEDDGLGAVDVLDRRLHRTFLLLEGDDDRPRFDRGGRLFGGFWQPLPPARRRSLRIDGETVADLDFQGMFLRLAYARVGAVPPVGDPYALPGLEGYRSGAKRGFNALLFHGRLPPGWGPWMAVGKGPDDGTEGPVAEDGELDVDGVEKALKVTGRLPTGWTPAVLRGALFAHHPPLQQAMRPRVGYELMFMESRILLEALGKLMGAGIVTLPMHDGLLVPRSSRDTARLVMEEAAGALSGAVIPVIEKVA